MSYLAPGLPVPVASPDGLDRVFWEGLAREELHVQACNGCGRFQWGPEWVCHRCHSDDLVWKQVEPRGVIYSFERVWHPVHPALKDQGAYLVVLVELEHADGVRMVGNLLGDPHQEVRIGAPVAGVFEHGASDGAEFALLQWRTA